MKETAKYLLRCPFVTRRYIREVERLYAMSAEEMRDYKERRFLEIFRKAYTKSKFYHKFYSEHGIGLEDIKTLDDLKKLPILTKEMVKAHGLEMLTEPKWKLVGNHTSGTTGTPLSVWESWPALWREQAYLYCYRKRCGYTYGQPIVSLRGNLEKANTHLKVKVSNTLYLSSYNINETNVQLYYDQITAHHPVAIEGYPSSLYSLALLLRDHGLRLHIPVAFTSSETLLDNQRQTIEDLFDTQIYDHFGTTERTIMLNETFNHNGYYEAPGYSINEYVEDGEITTSLINDAFPLIRYRGYDVMEMGEATSENPQIIVKSIEGRKEDFVTCKDGTKIMRLDFIGKGVDNIKAFQIVQEKEGELIISIVPEKQFTDNDYNLLTEKLWNRVGRNNMDCHFEIVEDTKGFKYTSNGKFRLILNLTKVKRGG